MICTAHKAHRNKEINLVIELTTVASEATLKPLLRVVISVFGASDGGESMKVDLTSGNASVMGTSDRCGCPPNSLEKKPVALDCTSLKAGTAEACVLDE